MAHTISGFEILLWSGYAMLPPASNLLNIVEIVGREGSPGKMSQQEGKEE